jgi:hypothetical protein
MTIRDLKKVEGMLTIVLCEGAKERKNKQFLVLNSLSRRDNMFVETNKHTFLASLWGRNVIRKSSVANQSNGNIHCVPDGTLGQDFDNNISTNIPSRWDEVAHCGIVEKKISKKIITYQ